MGTVEWLPSGNRPKARFLSTTVMTWQEPLPYAHTHNNMQKPLLPPLVLCECVCMYVNAVYHSTLQSSQEPCFTFLGRLQATPKVKREHA